jgi:thiol-disulfide isomerase/thioredoxin
MYALLINGGDQPDTNYRTHLQHLKQIHQGLLDRGLPTDNIAVFSADGESSEPDMAIRLPPPDPRAWLIEGTPAAKLSPREVLIDSEWQGVNLRPATNAGLQGWFLDASTQLKPGDQLLIYVTDHGRKGKEGIEDTTIALWKEPMSVPQFRQLLSSLHPEVQVVVTMSQCFSGGFAAALYPIDGAVPATNRCGWFASPPDRASYGCYAESKDQPLGHGFRWSEAIRRNQSLAEAHAEVVLTDRTPDVPLASSDLHLRKMLRNEARRRAMLPSTLVDKLLRDARHNPSEHTLTQLSTVYALSDSLGAGTPLSMQEAAILQGPLPALYEGLLRTARMWSQMLHTVRNRNYEVFVEQNPRWKRRLAKSDRLNPAQKRATYSELLDALDAFTPPDRWERIQYLIGRYDEAREGAWRTAVREAVVLRMATVLRRIAATQLLADEASDHLDMHRIALAELAACEQIIPGHATISTMAGEVQGDKWPALHEDLVLLTAVSAPWFGARDSEVSEALTERLQLPGGARTLQVVFEDSPASKAGLQPGDVLVGAPEAQFADETDMAEWLLTAPRDVPLPMRFWRGYRTYDTEITLQDWIQKPQPRSVQPGELIPLDLALFDRQGEPVQLPIDEPYLLFFWATWCQPCKLAAPEVARWSAETGVPVIAVTDQETFVLEAFVRRQREAFPGRIVIDPDRAVNLTLGVHSLPTFIHVGDQGQVLALQEGYSRITGLFP